MRYLRFLAPALLFGTLSTQLFAGVLVPEQSGSSVRSTTAVKPSTTLLEPSQAEPEVDIPAAIQQNMSSPGLDAVNTNVLDSISLDQLRKALPPEAQSLSDEDLKKVVAQGLTSSQNNEIAQYIITDPKTGQKMIDFKRLESKPIGVQGSVKIAPSGTLGPAPLTEDEAMTAKLMAQGYTLSKPKYEKVMEIAKAKQEEEFKAKFSRPPTMLQDIEINTEGNPFAKGSLLIGVMKDFTWGETDVKRISKALGYKREEIPMNCQMRLKIELKTGSEVMAQNAFMFAGEEKNVAIAGELKGFSIRPLAVCNPPAAAPQNGSVIFKHGDKYGILMGEASCQVPAPSNPKEKFVPTRAGIRYLGNSKIACAFKD